MWQDSARDVEVNAMSDDSIVTFLRNLWLLLNTEDLFYKLTTDPSRAGTLAHKDSVRYVPWIRTSLFWRRSCAIEMTERIYHPCQSLPTLFLWMEHYRDCNFDGFAFDTICYMYFHTSILSRPFCLQSLHYDLPQAILFWNELKLELFRIKFKHAQSNVLGIRVENPLKFTNYSGNESVGRD